jgi:hypothetical protein
MMDSIPGHPMTKKDKYKWKKQGKLLKTQFFATNYGSSEQGVLKQLTQASHKQKAFKFTYPKASTQRRAARKESKTWVRERKREQNRMRV